jgi:hypothetical protein
VLTPLPADPWSLVPVVVVASQLVLRPGRAQALAAGAVRDYAVPPAAVDLVRAWADREVQRHRRFAGVLGRIWVAHPDRRG